MLVAVCEHSVRVILGGTNGLGTRIRDTRLNKLDALSKPRVSSSIMTGTLPVQGSYISSIISRHCTK